MCPRPFAAPQILNRDKERMVRPSDVRTGLHWLRLVGGGAEGLAVHPSVLFEAGGASEVPGGVGAEYGIFRWDVPGTHSKLTPMLSGSYVLRAAATMFDLDGDNGLNAAEYNALQEAQFGMSALDKYDADETVVREAERARVKPADLANIAKSAGRELQGTQPLPLSALPQIWQTKASVRARQTKASPQNRLLWELANVLVVRVGSHLKREQTVTTYEGRPQVGGECGMAGVATLGGECGVAGVAT